MCSAESFAKFRRRTFLRLGSLPAGINNRCEPGDALRKHSEGAFSGGGIHHLRRPDAKASERCWSQLMISPPERCPVCVKHLPAHSGVLTAIKLTVKSNGGLWQCGAKLAERCRLGGLLCYNSPRL